MDTANCNSATCFSAVRSQSSTPSTFLWNEHARSDDEVEMRRFRNGEDVRYSPLIDRKLRLRSVVPRKGKRLLYCDHIERDGERLFGLICENDLEGVVAKRKGDPYLPEHAQWLKIRNRSYSQWAGPLAQTPIPAQTGDRAVVTCRILT